MDLFVRFLGGFSLVAIGVIIAVFLFITFTKTINNSQRSDIKSIFISLTRIQLLLIELYSLRTLLLFKRSVESFEKTAFMILQMSAYKESRGSLINNAPAAYAVRFLKFFYSKKTFELVFSEVISDGREEFFDAVKAGEKWRARWRNVSLHLNLLVAVVLWFSTGIAKKLLQFWKLIP